MDSQSKGPVTETMVSRPGCASAMCSIIPHMLLKDILKYDGHSESTRVAVSKTLQHLESLQRNRKAKQHSRKSIINLSSSEDEPCVSKDVCRMIYDSEKTRKLRKVLLFDEANKSAAVSMNDHNAQQVFDHFGKAHQFYNEVFGRNSIDDNGLKLIGNVHYDDIPGDPGMDNAFWDGDEMAFGDGDGEIFGSFTNNIDVIGHELTHGVVQFTAGLEYEYQSGALNESLADVFGSMIKQYFHPDGKQLATDADWLIGCGLFLPSVANASALRSMKAPGTAYNNPKIGRDRQGADMDQYRNLPNKPSGDWGGVHVNSGIPNRAFYLVATALGGYSWDVAGQIWYRALLDEDLKDIDTKTAFKVFADLTSRYALSLFDEEIMTVVKNAWAAVKVYNTAAEAQAVEQRLPKARL